MPAVLASEGQRRATGEVAAPCRDCSQREGIPAFRASALDLRALPVEASRRAGEDLRVVDLRGRRLLIIEDEAAITMLIEDLVADLGAVIAGFAARMADAGTKIDTLDYDVAMLDVNLGGQQSFALADKLIARGKPFVFATGYGRAVIPEALRNVPILQKPFRVAEFAAALREALKT
jgi:CheY-like chemotaxis protein